MPEPSPDKIRQTLKVLLDSPDFDKSARSRRFLEFVVQAKLEGKELELSQNLLAAVVFDRRGPFDPGTDPIVRIQAGRVRRTLDHYYLTHNDQSLVRIVIPKGTYAPIFLQPEGVPDSSSGSAKSGMPAGKQPVDSGVPVIVVCPFANLTGNADLDYVIRGLPMRIAVEADRTRDARIIVSPVDPFDRTDRDPADTPTDLYGHLCLRGALQTDGTSLRLDIQLIRCATQQQIWAHHIERLQPEIEMAAFLDNAAKQVALKVFNEGGVLYLEQIRQLPSDPGAHASTHEAILRFLDWQVAPDPEVFEKVVAGLQKAVQQDPRNGVAKTFLARCYVDLWALDFRDVPVRIEEAMNLALEGLRINPDDCRANCIVAYAYLVADDLEASLQYTKTALAQARGSLLFLDTISYLLTLCGDWERGPKMLRKAIHGNPFHAAFVHGALWLDAIRRQDYLTARQEALAIRSSCNFWGPLTRCVALAYLGQIEAAARQCEELLRFQPGFAERGDWLIRRYVKDDALIASIKQGLALAGMDVSRLQAVRPCSENSQDR